MDPAGVAELVKNTRYNFRNAAIGAGSKRTLLKGAENLPPEILLQKIELGWLYLPDQK